LSTWTSAAQIGALVLTPVIISPDDAQVVIVDLLDLSRLNRRTSEF
jgi:hypothetical protein